MITAIIVQVAVGLILFAEEPLLNFYLVLMVCSSIGVQVLHMAFSGVSCPCYEFVSAAGVVMLAMVGIEPTTAILLGKAMAFFASPMVLLIAWVFGS